ncbi:MAG: helix-turn-helix domain-containing protein [Sneathiella sp.]
MAKIKTRDRIKIAAQGLFAERGIEAVTVREIVAAAQQKNMASLHYYFRTKQELATELLRDAAVVIESHRTTLLDELEKKGGPHTLLEVLQIFIECAIVPGDDPRNLSNVRLFVLAFRDDPKFVNEVLGDQSEGAYLRCINYCRHFMNHLTPEQIEMRLYLMQTYVFQALSSRESALSIESNHTKMWEQEMAVEELIKTTEGLLLA